MAEIWWDDTVSILNYGLVSQRDIAELNRLASAIIRKRDYDGVLKCFNELLSISALTDPQQLLEKEQRIDHIQEEFCRNRIEIMKEAKLLKELRHTNDAYIERIGSEIAEAQKICREKQAAAAKVRPDNSLDLIRKRVYELTTSKVVAENFSAQLKLSEGNAFDMAEKLWNALATILPLLRGSISIEADKTRAVRTGKLIREMITDISNEYGEAQK